MAYDVHLFFSFALCSRMTSESAFQLHFWVGILFSAPIVVYVCQSNIRVGTPKIPKIYCVFGQTYFGTCKVRRLLTSRKCGNKMEISFFRLVVNKLRHFSQVFLKIFDKFHGKFSRNFHNNFLRTSIQIF